MTRRSTRLISRKYLAGSRTRTLKTMLRALAGSRCEHAWRSQRPANDWTGFADNLREVVRLSRQEAQIRADA
ncbi:hypothetical protein LAN30_25965, partial [Mycobacterium tuberculosis]|nr:hypothetical protein [Mycobacterium tuberculosis]